MVMVTRHGDVLRTDATETFREGDDGTVPAIMDQQSSEPWNRWWDQRFENEGVFEVIGRAFHEHVNPLEDQLAAQAKQIAELERRVAELTGAIDVLRTVGSGGINHRGAYDEGASYARGDAAMSGGSSFIAIRDHAGPCPGPDWRLLASAGKRGQRGERGPSGPAVKLRWATFDSAKMALSIIMSDGSSSLIPLKALFADVRVDPSDYSIKLAMHDGTELSFSLRSLFAQYDQEKRGY
jgi:hypothetical protein